MHEDHLPGRISAASLVLVKPLGRLTVMPGCVRAPSFQVIQPMATINDATLRLFAADCALHVLNAAPPALPGHAVALDAVCSARRYAMGAACTKDFKAARHQLWTLAGQLPRGAWATALEAAGDAAGITAWAAARYASERARWAAAGCEPGRMRHQDAWHAEWQWQHDRFLDYLFGRIALKAEAPIATLQTGC